MTIENLELTHECCIQHLPIVTAKNETAKKYMKKTSTVVKSELVNKWSGHKTKKTSTVVNKLTSEVGIKRRDPRLSTSEVGIKRRDPRLSYLLMPESSRGRYSSRQWMNNIHYLTLQPIHSPFGEVIICSKIYHMLPSGAYALLSYSMKHCSIVFVLISYYRLMNHDGW